MTRRHPGGSPCIFFDGALERQPAIKKPNFLSHRTFPIRRRPVRRKPQCSGNRIAGFYLHPTVNNRIPLKNVYPAVCIQEPSVTRISANRLANPSGSDRTVAMRAAVQSTTAICVNHRQITPERQMRLRDAKQQESTAGGSVCSRWLRGPVDSSSRNPPRRWELPGRHGPPKQRAGCVRLGLVVGIHPLLSECVASEWRPTQRLTQW